MHDYIVATATVVVRELARRGFVLHYVIDNTQGEANLAAMLTYIPPVLEGYGRDLAELAVLAAVVVYCRFLSSHP